MSLAGLVKTTLSKVSVQFNLKLRHALLESKFSPSLFRNRISRNLELNNSSKIVVIGIGPAALSCLDELYKLGFKDVTVVAKDENYGGKCVNYGCMPIEFVINKAQSNLPITRDEVNNFIEALKDDVAHKFRSYGYRIIIANVKKIERNTIFLEGGNKLHFDRLISAAGGKSEIPAIFKDIESVCNIEKFWQLEDCINLIIYSDNNIGALGIAYVAKCFGMEVSVLLGKNNYFLNLPSFKYFIRHLKKNDIKIYDNVKLKYCKNDEIGFSSHGKEFTLSFDNILYTNVLTPNFFEVDGKKPTIYDLDLARASDPVRPDIIYIGDNGGYLTANQAEIQAKLIVNAWKNNSEINLTVLKDMPIVIHADKALAIYGSEWTYLEKNWEELDFKALGWSKVHNLEGKIWYLVDKKNNKIYSIHICHRLAADLIYLGSCLMNYRLDDVQWLKGSVHPAAGEIFRVIALESSYNTNDQLRKAVVSPTKKHFKFIVPEVSDILPQSLPPWLTIDSWNKCLLESKPEISNAIYFGLFKLEDLGQYSLGRNIYEVSDGVYSAKDTPNLNIFIDRNTKNMIMEYADIRLEIVI